MRTARRLRLFALVAVLYGSPPIAVADAQYMRVGIEGQIVIGELDTMEDALRLANPVQKADLLVRLGVAAAVASRSAEAMLPGEEIALRPLNHGGAQALAFAFLPDGTSGYAHLYLLRQSVRAGQQKTWSASDHLQLSCWRVHCSFEQLSLTVSGTDAILLHHVSRGHGSGMVIDQTQLVLPDDGRLRTVLSTEDYNLRGEMAGFDRRVRTSTFLLMPNGALEESRSTSINDRLSLVDRRYWTWFAAQHRFVGSAFHPVAAPAP